MQQLPNPEEDLRATRQRTGAPGRKGLSGGLDGSINVVRGREFDVARLLAGRRVEHRTDRPALAGVRPRRRSNAG